MALQESPPFWWRRPGWQSLLLAPLSWIYGGIGAKRMEIPPSESVEVPVICVGNFIAGGAGKTPTVLALVKSAKSMGFRPGILSRGHGGGVIVATLVDLDKHDSRDIGDEPILLAKAASTVVSIDRPAGARLLVENGCNLIIMDDGFQNPYLRKDYSLVVVNAKRGIGNGFAHPAGPLRAPLSRQLPMADAILIIGDGNGADNLIRHAAKLAKPIQLARTVIRNARRLKGKALFAYAGIADPEKFFTSLRDVGADLVECRSFGDHHHYHLDEIEDLLEKSSQQSLLLVSTAKDLARLNGLGELQQKLVANTDAIDINLKFEDPNFASQVITSAVNSMENRRSL